MKDTFVEVIGQGQGNEVEISNSCSTVTVDLLPADCRAESLAVLTIREAEELAGTILAHAEAAKRESRELRLRDNAVRHLPPCGVCGEPSVGVTESTDASLELPRCTRCVSDTAGAFIPWREVETERIEYHRTAHANRAAMKVGLPAPFPNLEHWATRRDGSIEEVTN